jgi:hypothetical protein
MIMCNEKVTVYIVNGQHFILDNDLLPILGFWIFCDIRSVKDGVIVLSLIMHNVWVALCSVAIDNQRI